MFFPTLLSKSSAAEWDEASMHSVKRGPDPWVSHFWGKQSPLPACGSPELGWQLHDVAG